MKPEPTPRGCGSPSGGGCGERGFGRFGIGMPKRRKNSSMSSSISVPPGPAAGARPLGGADVDDRRPDLLDQLGEVGQADWALAACGATAATRLSESATAPRPWRAAAETSGATEADAFGTPVEVEERWRRSGTRSVRRRRRDEPFRRLLALERSGEMPSGSRAGYRRPPSPTSRPAAGQGDGGAEADEHRLGVPVGAVALDEDARRRSGRRSRWSGRTGGAFGSPAASPGVSICRRTQLTQPETGRGLAHRPALVLEAGRRQHRPDDAVAVELLHRLHDALRLRPDADRRRRRRPTVSRTSPRSPITSARSSRPDARSAQSR